MQSKTFGLPREAYFFNAVRGDSNSDSDSPFSTELRTYMPHTYWALGDMDSGTSVRGDAGSTVDAPPLSCVL